MDACSTKAPEIYQVAIRTRCKGCAMLLAGMAPKLGTATAVFVNAWDRKEGCLPLTFHANGPGIQSHDGSPMACPEHGDRLLAGGVR